MTLLWVKITAQQVVWGSNYYKISNIKHKDNDLRSMIILKRKLALDLSTTRIQTKTVVKYIHLLRLFKRRHNQQLFQWFRMSKIKLWRILRNCWTRMLKTMVSCKYELRHKVNLLENPCKNKNCISRTNWSKLVSLVMRLKRMKALNGSDFESSSMRQLRDLPI